MKENKEEEKRNDLEILNQIFDLPENALEIIRQLNKLRQTTDEIEQSLIQMNNEIKKQA